MPILPLFALVGQTLSPKDVVARYDKFYKEHPAITVQIQVRSNMDGFGGQGTVSVNRPGIRIDITGPGLGYMLVMDASNGFEANSKEKVYAEFGGSKDLGKVAFRLSDTMADLNLDPLIAGSMGKQIGWKSAERAPAGDLLRAHAEGMEGVVDIEAEVDAEGHLTRWKTTRSKTLSSPKSWIETTFSNYSFGALSPSVFSMDPPVGWTAVGLKLPSMPIQPQEDAPEAPVLNPDGQRMTFKDMLHGRTVVEYLDPEWVSSPLGVSVLSNVDAQFKAAGITIIRLLDSSAKKEKGYYTDPTGELLGELNPQGSPTFFLFSSKGKLDQAFFALSPREPESLFKDVASRLKELAQK